jgi:hypothetical protein
MTSLPLNRVTLYTSPLGYFERRADAPSDTSDEVATFHLDVPIKQKDLVVDTMSLSMPSASSVSVNFSGNDINHPQQDDSATNGYMDFDFGPNKSQGDILASLIGSQLLLRTQSGEKPGLLMSVEKKKINVGSSSSTQIESVWDKLSLMNDETYEIETVPLDELLGFKIVDQTLQAELMKALAASLKRIKAKPA